MPQGRAQSRRDVPIVAWHEVLETAPPQNNRPVGHGMIGRRPSCCPLTPMGADCGGAATDDLVPEVFRVERCAMFFKANHSNHRIGRAPGQTSPTLRGVSCLRPS
jgi:hypothetical protein